MADLTLTGVGSIVLNIIENVPTALSGALPFLANTSLEYVKSYTGQNIGSNSIPDLYQGAVVYLTAAKVSRAMSLVGTDKGFRLGELSVNAGGASSDTETVAVGFDKLAQMELARIGVSTRYGRTY